MNELTIRPEATARHLTNEQYETIRIVASALHQSRYYANITTPERAMFLMARAYELGFPITGPMDVFDDIQGRLTLKPQAAWALVLASNKLADMQVEEGEDYCEIRLKRTDVPFWQSYRFSLSDAQRAGLVKPDGNYNKWLKNMLYWRALGFVIDRTFPDVTLGMKDSVQFGAPVPEYRVDTESGEIIEAEVVA